MLSITACSSVQVQGVATPGHVAPVFLRRDFCDTADDPVPALARAVQARAVSRDDHFCRTLNRHLHEDLEKAPRQEENLQSPAVTLSTRHGACRDLAVVFVETCREVGLPARYVSGYVMSSTLQTALHGWAEVLLPQGWCGFDPTLGDPAGGSHVVLCTGPGVEETTPLCGGFLGVNAVVAISTLIQTECHDA